jgi:uncharacterized protein
MLKTPGTFRAALLIGWLTLGPAGILFARSKNVPVSAALPMLAAFLVAYPFYLVPAFPAVRERLAGNRLPGYLAASAVLPYLAACLGPVEFTWSGFARMAALALVFSLWYRVLPAHPVADFTFLALVPGVLLGGYFDAVFVAADRTWVRYGVVLGHVILIQLAVMTLLLERRTGEFGFGFIPNREEWRIGGIHYLYFLLVGVPLAWLLQAVTFTTVAPWWKVAALFLGSLWVVSLSEEFLVRGVLFHWIEQWTWSRTAALILTSVFFGFLHIGFRRFPNWRWVLIATVLGWFCGRARVAAGSIRAGIVTHSLVVATWQAFFR